MLDISHDLLNPGLKVARWSFDMSAGQINAVDDNGRVLMIIQASPLFGPRLAAAFTSPVPQTVGVGGFGR
jgi:hypothetical protein